MMKTKCHSEIIISYSVKDAVKVLNVINIIYDYERFHAEKYNILSLQFEF